MTTLPLPDPLHDHIEVRGARVHNLKDLSLDIPRDRLVAVTGVSGSGKSSLVFDTLHTEAQRQLIETFSSFARRRLPKLSRPDVDEVRNLSTSIVIDQQRLGRTLRSTVGTATEIYTYLRMLYARCGSLPEVPSFIFGFNHPEGMCPACSGLGRRIRVDLDQLIDPALSLRQGAITHPDWKVGGWNWREATAIDLFDPDKPLREYTPQELDLLLYGDEVPIERSHGAGTYAKVWRGAARRLERALIDKGDDPGREEQRDVYQRYFSYDECDACGGLRLNARALSATVDGVGIGAAVQMELGDLDRWLGTLDDPVARPLVHKMRRILSHLLEIGVGYLSLNRAVSTLSGGESQRLKMARQLDCDLVGLMYVLDEPSIGLHPRDVDKLVGLLRHLRELGNSVLVVEHHAAVIAAADHVIEIGPQAGSDGGRLCFEGNQARFRDSDALTASMMARPLAPVPRARRRPTGAWHVRGANTHNLQAVDVDIPRGVFVAVTGVAGSGKSTLVHDEFLALAPDAVVVDQDAIGRSSRSNPLTWLGLFDIVRKAFATASGRPAAVFSFNSKGACESCKGQGSIAVEMSFLDDVRVTCADCGGKRYRDEVLRLEWDGRDIHEVLSLTTHDAIRLLPHEGLRSRLQVVEDVGLGYLTLGQPLSTLSGGECQRLKLASELGKAGGRLYVLDEPTTGLHAADIERLLAILDRIVEDGNSVVVIEHDLDVIAAADWVIDLGPEGGQAGGRVVAAGTPEQVAGARGSHTGRYLAEHLALNGLAS